MRWKVGEAISLDCTDSYGFLLSFKGFAATLFDSVEKLLGVESDNSGVRVSTLDTLLMLNRTLVLTRGLINELGGNSICGRMWPMKTATLSQR